MFTNALDRSITLTDGTNDSLHAVFTDEGDLWVRTTEGRVVSLSPSEVKRLVTFLTEDTDVPAFSDLDLSGVDDAPSVDDRIAMWLIKLTNSQTFVDFTAEKLNKYVRIVSADRRTGASRSVHAFVDAVTGDVYKPAGWKAPAKHVRFNLLDDASYERMLEVCDPYGSYLYIR